MHARESTLLPAKMTTSELEVVHSRILTQAVDDYLNTIPDHDPLKAKLKADIQTTVQDLPQHVKVLERGFSNWSGYSRLLDRLNLVIEKFERFTKVVEVCIQSDPMLSALIWGGFKFLLQVASEFREFFEKLLRMIEKITNVLPDYELFLEGFPEDENLQRHVVQQAQSATERAGILRDIAESEEQRRIATKKMQEANVREKLEMEERFAKDRQFCDIRAWLDPAKLRDIRERISRKRHLNTGLSILDSEKYKPGAGKTFLSVFLIEDAESRSTKGAVASFICHWSDKQRSSLRALLATILFQLLAGNKELTPLLDAFALAMMESMSSVASSVKELWELLAITLKLCPFSTIIADGIDELDEDDGEWTAR
ncbi:hypothetical protein K440DRAFT_667188 [Wilcoxina mikolae CBS 423.85]|nr:hypothetical protein K440DRAFT_667188 [Wilcoxina mikolae CBS 423.85]